MAVNGDGNLVILSAGTRLLVLERPASAQDWSNFTVRFNHTATDYPIVDAVISMDGSYIAFSCGLQGTCVYSWSVEQKAYTSAFTVPYLLGLATSELQFSYELQPLLVVGFCMFTSFH
jgi:hypothetical protein